MIYKSVIERLKGVEGYLWDFSIIYLGINKLSHNDIQKMSKTISSRNNLV